MQILHISDLHFGNHNDALTDALRRRVDVNQPEVIVVTGDIADSPRKALFDEAYSFLHDLAARCKTQVDGPRLIVIPGNHDRWRTGVYWSPFRSDYYRSFGNLASHGYYEKENVWIFGFDSASRRPLATGEVLKEDLVRFHKQFEELSKAHAGFKSDAFKIAVIHHHPLPVNWDTDWRQQLLTMTNSGTFLAAMLEKRVNLVLHGHEHLQGRARLHSTLGGDDTTELVVVSLGATLRKVKNPAQNWFNLLTIGSATDPAGRQVVLESFPSDQFDFRNQGEIYTIQSAQVGRERQFESWARRLGFRYQGVASIADLNADGDCHRTVECDDLEILHARSSRAESHKLDLPRTSGYIDLLDVAVDKTSAFQGIFLKQHTNPVKKQTETATIQWGTRLTLKDRISYRYHWWAINSFAMNSHQFRKKYGDPSSIEFTHFPVVDPIKELLVVVRFPKGFNPLGRPQVRVSRIDETIADNRFWPTVRELELELIEKNALRYLDSVGIAALRITMPLEGYSYGIQWKIPEANGDYSDPHVQQLVSRLFKASRDLSRKMLLLPIVTELGRMMKRELVPDWTDPLEFTFMLFDEFERKLIVLSAAIIGSDTVQLDTSSKMEFRYGEGIAGRAFKTNEIRMYVHREVEKRTTPNYYRRHAGQEPDAVLLSFPMRSPNNPEYVFGVFNVTSSTPRCPLVATLEPNGITEERLGTVQAALNICAVNTLETLAKGHII